MRALTALLAVWIAGRGLALWGWADMPQIEPVYARAGVAVPEPAQGSVERDIDPRGGTARIFAQRRGGAEGAMSLRTAAPLRETVPKPAALARPVFEPDPSDSLAQPVLRSTTPASAAQSASLRPPRLDTPSAWRGSAWLAVRDGAGSGLGSTGQLGGSQAGIRVYRALTPVVALTARGSAALSSPGAEASAGIALRKGSVMLLAERRAALDRGGRNGWSLTATGGFSDIALPLDLRLDGYAQAGLVDRDAFADGALRIERTVSTSREARLSLGAGVWGGIQPGVARLDIGPQLVARTALAGRPARLSLEWRQRVAGNAAPGSGPSVTIGTDF